MPLKYRFLRLLMLAPLALLACGTPGAGDSPVLGRPGAPSFLFFYTDN